MGQGPSYIKNTLGCGRLNGSVHYFTSGISCAKFLHVSNNTITQRLNDGKPVKTKEGLIVAQRIKRIKVYSSFIIPEGSGK